MRIRSGMLESPNLHRGDSHREPSRLTLRDALYDDLLRFFRSCFFNLSFEVKRCSRKGGNRADNRLEIESRFSDLDRSALREEEPDRIGCTNPKPATYFGRNGDLILAVDLGDNLNSGTRTFLTAFGLERHWHGCDSASTLLVPGHDAITSSTVPRANAPRPKRRESRSGYAVGVAAATPPAASVNACSMRVWASAAASAGGMSLISTCCSMSGRISVW